MIIQEKEVDFMEKQIINITDEQRQNLVDEIANLVANFKKMKMLNVFILLLIKD